MTLPVLSEGLGAQGVAALTRAARSATDVGCRCPSCGKAMALLKVETEGQKVEIDVCATCLSIWCDRGEFERLSPARPTAPGKASLHDLAMRASPEARERLAQAMLERGSDSVEMSDMTLGEIATDLVRVVVGAPNLWRTVRPATPILAVLMALALPIGQYLAYDSWHGRPDDCISLLATPRPRVIWLLDPAMMKAGGWSLASPGTSLFTYLFLQESGSAAVLDAMVVLFAFSLVERKAGHAQSLVLFGALWLTSVLAHGVQLVLSGSPDSALCGIAPIATGFMAYLYGAYPNLHWRSPHGKGDVLALFFYLLITVMFVFERLVAMLRLPTYSFGLGALAACCAVGWWMGRRRADRCI